MKQHFGLLLSLACLSSCAQQSRPLSELSPPKPISQPIIVPPLGQAATVSPASVLSGLASPNAAYDDGHSPLTHTLTAPASMPAVTEAPHAFVAPAQPVAPVTIMPQAAPTHMPEALVDPDRPTPPPLAPITIPSGNAAENTSGWGRR